MLILLSMCKWDITREAEYISSFGLIVYVPQISSSPQRTFNSSGDADSQQSRQEDMLKVMKTFLKAYGDIASFVPENEKVKIVYKPHSRSFSSPLIIERNNFGVERQRKSEIISAEVVKSDIMAYRSEEITAEELENSIEVYVNEDVEDDVSFRIFKNILDETLDNQFSTKDKHVENGFYFDDNQINIFSTGSHSVDYELIKGLGVVYQVALRIPSDIKIIKHGNNRRKRIIIKGDNVITYSESDSDDDEIIEDADEEGIEEDEIIVQGLEEEEYEKLIASIQEVMVDYGRTLRKLSEDEYLIVRFELPPCSDCDLPAKVEYKIKKEVLSKYDRGSIGLDEATDEIEESETGKASELEYKNNHFRWGDGYGFNDRDIHIDMPNIDIDIPEVDIDIPTYLKLIFLECKKGWKPLWKNFKEYLKRSK